MLRRIQIDSASEWDRCLAPLPRPHPLQSWAWGAVKSRWGWQMRPTLWLVDDRPAAAALILKRSLPYAPLSLLYVPKGPVLDFADAPLRQMIWQELETLARREHAIALKIDPDVVCAWGMEGTVAPAGVALAQELQHRGWRFSAEQVQFRNTVTLDLTQPEETLLAAMKPKTRYNIRLAARKGVTVRLGTTADFPALLQLYQTTADRNGFAIRPAAYYLDVWNTLYVAGMAQPLLAEYEGVLVAGVMVVRYGAVALYMYGASDEQERQRMPTYLVQWEAIRWARAQGCQVYDFWGAPDVFAETDRLWGVWRFKSGFNGQVAQHIGAWDYAPWQPLYWGYANLLPRYINWLRSRRPGAMSPADTT